MKLRVVPSALSLILSDTASGYSHAVMWSKGTITDQGTLDSTQSAVYAINDNGQVAGWAHTVSEATHVFMRSNGTITDLGTFGLDPVGEAINNHSVIVGQSSPGRGYGAEGCSRTSTT